MNLGARIRASRKAAGLTQVALANRAGLKQSVISDLENGNVLTTTFLVNIAIALGVSPKWLQTGKDGPADTLEIVQIWLDLDPERRERLLATARDLRTAQMGNVPAISNPYAAIPLPTHKKSLKAEHNPQ